MKVRQHSPVLPNLLKRDPSAYREEFEAIWRQYLAALEAFRLGGASQKKTRGDDERKLGIWRRSSPTAASTTRRRRSASLLI